MSDPNLFMTPSRRTLLGGIAAAGAAPVLARMPAAIGPDAAITNPLVRQRADAQVFRHTDGWYYMTGSVPEYDRLVLRRSRTLAGLSTAQERVLWRHQAKGPLSGFIWAPELHKVDGRWVMYFAAGPSGGGEDVFRIRTWAVACDGADPMTGNWSVLGQFQAPWDSFNLDSTSFVHHGTRYFCWAQREPGIETNSNLYLAPMASALTLARKPVRLSVPTLEWEIQGFKVNEAPAVLQRHGRVFITYSASATDRRYCLGMLTARDDADLMDAASWTKSPVPVFTTSDATHVYGPGHNSFTVDEAGRDMLVYHGRDYAAIKGDPLFDPNRHTRVQRLYYRADGVPDFGIPVGNGPLPDRLSPLDRAGSYLMVAGDRLMLGQGPVETTQFRQRPGLAGGDSVSLEPITRPGWFVAGGADGAAMLVQAATGAAGAAQASFRVRRGRDAVSFESVAAPGTLLHHAGDTLRIGRASMDASARFAVS